MSVGERDSHTGHMTTGHEWNGIKELNTAVPRPVYFFLIVTIAFSIGYWILMPAWPTGLSFTKGLLHNDQKEIVADDLKKAATVRDPWTRSILAGSYSAIAADPQLMPIVRQYGGRLFKDNCAACHGVNAQGGPGFPDLTTASWLWGGDPATIEETIRAGINSPHKDSRVSQMPSFGRDQMLSRAEILNVVSYVQSLSGNAEGITTEAIGLGQTLYAANCASCHGEDGKGSTDVGAPDLTDKSWVYGGDRQSIYTSVWAGRQGQMPTWEPRLSPADRKVLALYVASLRRVNP